MIWVEIENGAARFRLATVSQHQEAALEANDWCGTFSQFEEEVEVGS